MPPTDIKILNWDLRRLLPQVSNNKVHLLTPQQTSN